MPSHIPLMACSKINGAASAIAGFFAVQSSRQSRRTPAATSHGASSPIALPIHGRNVRSRILHATISSSTLGGSHGASQRPLATITELRHMPLFSLPRKLKVESPRGPSETSARSKFQAPSAKPPAKGHNWCSCSASRPDFQQRSTEAAARLARGPQATLAH